MSVSPRTGQKLFALRLNSPFRYALYTALAVLFATGTAWLVADQLKDAPDSETWQSIGATLLMLHGGAAMVTLMLFGALFPLHIHRSWRGQTNQIMGVLMLAVSAVLIATAFGLYYLGSDTARPWLSSIHTDVGLALPALLLVHIVVGRWGR